VLVRTLVYASAVGLPVAALSVTQQLGGVQLTPLVDGYTKGSAISLSSLWEGRGAVVFAVRRPG